jgi:serine/threonine-protein kinase
MRLEGQALAELNHPNVVQVTDFGETPAGRPFLVSELLQGRTLQDELKARRFLPVHEAIELAVQMLSGLSAAHEKGIVHRDIKPANLFLCRTGDRRVLKILDFGIAKLVKTSKGIAPLAVPTAEGMALGTPRFFSPEQARGAAVDERTDLYGVGVVLYTMVAGRGPFDHYRSLPDLSVAHAKEVPEPASAHASQPIPAGLDRVLMKALAKEREDRQKSALALIDELRQLERDGDEPVTRPAPRRALAAHGTEIVDTRALLANLPAARAPAVGAVSVAPETAEEAAPFATLAPHAVRHPSPVLAATPPYAPSPALQPAKSGPFPRMDVVVVRGRPAPRSRVPFVIVVVVSTLLFTGLGMLVLLRLIR